MGPGKNKNQVSRLYILQILLELSLCHVRQHLSASNPGSMPQSREIKSAGQSIGETKSKHGRNPATGVFEGKAGVIHLVLLDLAAAKVMHGALGVDFRLVVTGSGRVCGLSALEDVEIVVCGVAASVSFGSNGGSCVPR